AIAHVAAAEADAFGPVVEVERTGEFHVDAAHADAGAADAREIGLAAQLEREAAIEDVVEAVEFIVAIGVHRTDEVAQAFGHVNEEFVGADAATVRNLIAGEFADGVFIAERGMGVAGDGFLGLRPAENRRAPARPLLLVAAGAGVVLILQAQETN